MLPSMDALQYKALNTSATIYFKLILRPLTLRSASKETRDDTSSNILIKKSSSSSRSRYRKTAVCDGLAHIILLLLQGDYTITLVRSTKISLDDSLAQHRLHHARRRILVV